VFAKYPLPYHALRLARPSLQISLSPASFFNPNVGIGLPYSWMCMFQSVLFWSLWIYRPDIAYFYNFSGVTQTTLVRSE